MAGTNILGGMAIMKGRDAEHVRVLRLRPGEDMIICDGQGTDYKCRLVKADKEQVEAEVIEVVRCPAEPRFCFSIPTAASQGRISPKRSLSAGSASPKRPRSSPDAGLSRRSAGRAISQERWTLQ